MDCARTFAAEEKERFVQTFSTVIWLSVSVPVLSEAMTVAELRREGEGVAQQQQPLAATVTGSQERMTPLRLLLPSPHPSVSMMSISPPLTRASQ